MEEWKQHPYLSVEVSSEGRVRSLQGVLKKLHRGNHGYLCASLIAGKAHSRMVHLLVLETFVAPAGEGQQGRHLNGNQTDNRLSNLQWGTPKENAADKLAHGTLLLGSNHPSARFSAKDVELMRAMRAVGFPIGHIHPLFGCSQSHASALTRGRYRASEGGHLTVREKAPLVVRHPATDRNWERDAGIVSALRRGVSVEALAQRFKLTTARIYQIYNAAGFRVQRSRAA